MKPEDVLQHCLEDIAAGRSTAAECAREFSGLTELEGQLAAAATLRAWQAPTLRPEADRLAEARPRRHAHALALRPRPRFLRMPRWQASVLRWATSVTLVVVALSAGADAVSASSASLPGQLLYPVKRASESVQAVLTPAAGRATLHSTLAQRRLSEILSLYARGVDDPAALADLSTDLSIEMREAVRGIEHAPVQEQAEILSGLAGLIEQQQDVLSVVRASPAPRR